MIENKIKTEMKNSCEIIWSNNVVFHTVLNIIIQIFIKVIVTDIPLLSFIEGSDLRISVDAISAFFRGLLLFPFLEELPWICTFNSLLTVSDETDFNCFVSFLVISFILLTITLYSFSPLSYCTLYIPSYTFINTDQNNNMELNKHWNLCRRM